MIIKNKMKLICLIFLISPFVFAQKYKDSVVVFYNKLQIRPQFGLYYQRNTFLNFGLSIHCYKVDYQKGGKESEFEMLHYGIAISTDIIIRFDQTLISPKLSFDFMGIGPTTGSAFGIDLNYFKNQANSFIGITPKLILPLNYLGLYYGYTFYISQNYYNHLIGHHRIGINCNLNRKYVKKCKEMYSEYSEYKSQFE